MGWNTTQLYRDYNKPWHKDPFEPTSIVWMFPKMGVGWAPPNHPFSFGGVFQFSSPSILGCFPNYSKRLFFSEMNGYWSCEKENTWTTYILKPINWWSGWVFWAFSAWGLFRFHVDFLAECLNTSICRWIDFIEKMTLHIQQAPQNRWPSFFFPGEFWFWKFNDPRGVWWCFFWCKTGRFFVFFWKPSASKVQKIWWTRRFRLKGSW